MYIYMYIDIFICRKAVCVCPNGKRRVRVCACVRDVIPPIYGVGILYASLRRCNSVYCIYVGKSSAGVDRSHKRKEGRKEGQHSRIGS